MKRIIVGEVSQRGVEEWCGMEEICGGVVWRRDVTAMSVEEMWRRNLEKQPIKETSAREFRSVETENLRCCFA